MHRRGLMLRKLEQLERKVQPQHEGGGFVVVDHSLTVEEAAEIRKKYGDVMIIYEDLPLPE